MKQLFKTVYFNDHPGSSTQRKNIKIAFGEKDRDLYDYVSSMSSFEIRSIIGYSSYQDLQKVAAEEYIPINTFCLRAIRQKLRETVDDSGQLSLLPTYSDYDDFLRNSIHATFRGGGETLLHHWYPLLEGYSPKFVELIVHNFMPSAMCIYDPFAGVGTTPLTVSKLGKLGIYSEINPLFQFIIRVKATALSLDSKTKRDVSNELNHAIRIINECFNEYEPDKELERTYYTIFGDSKFFKDETFLQILRMRTLIDDIEREYPLIADFITIASLASLVPCSLLVRAGDLRFKNEKELKMTKTFDFKKAFFERVNKIASDIMGLSRIDNIPLLLTEDAKNIELVQFNDIDGIITSPPYLNGTNYFRNTKLELWFLRALHSKQDLARFRERSVTSGINDVSRRKSCDSVNEIIKPTLALLEKHAYDQRIPRMFVSYFSEMEHIFKGISEKLNKNATIAIDIGDSVYAGVHVPTDKILTSLLNEIGFKTLREINLRTRLSRNGKPLKQSLIVLKKEGGFTKRRYDHPKWKDDWRSFTSGLPHQKHPFSKRNWGHPLHSLCSYQGKMKPSLAHHLVKTFIQGNGKKILDPFSGVGTIPFEAALQGCMSYGFEISPAARIIASAKLGRPNASNCYQTLSMLEEYLESEQVTSLEWEKIQEINFNHFLPDYFHEKTLKEIILARRFFLENPPKTSSECLVVACILHILHGNRPYALSRRSHGITPFSPTGEFIYKPLITHLKHKLDRSLAVEFPQCFVEGKIFDQNATSWWPQEVNELDAIITSPPFYDSTRFYLANWMRLWFCGWDKRDFQVKPKNFIDEKQKSSFSVYEPVFRQARERLKKDGVLVLHLGRSKKCDMAKELSQIASKWFKVEDIFVEDVQHCETHGIRDKGTVVCHQYMVLT